MRSSFFTPSGENRFEPTDHCRGPWDPNACHAGPPTGLLARAMEAVVPELPLRRITADLARPVPMAPLSVEVEVIRRGRQVAATAARLVDDEGVVRVQASGMHVRSRDVGDIPTVVERIGDPDDAAPGPFPISATLHGLPGFNDSAAVEVRYPPGQDGSPGATTLWMRTVPLLPGEEPSPFQRICPLADCGNAIARLAEPWQVGFVNPDLTLVLHRDPVGEWLGSQAVSRWEPTGVGLADAVLFDRHGVVGRALQTVLLSPPA